MMPRSPALTLGTALLALATQASAEDAAPSGVATTSAGTAPSRDGGVGLAHMLTARVGAPLRLRVGLHGSTFTEASFVVSGSGNLGGDRNTSTRGGLALSLTGPDLPVLRNLELFGTLTNASNRNVREDPARTDPEVILSLAETTLGLKAAFDTQRGQSFGVALQARLFTGLGDVTTNLDATSATLDLLGSFDVAQLTSRAIPLRVHTNARLVYDPSLVVLPAGQCAYAVGGDACIRSRVVQAFAYGLGSDRMRLSLGLEAPLFGELLVPFAEYHLGLALSDGDTVIARALERAPQAPTTSGTLSQYATLGLRVMPTARVAVDLGVDAGLQGASFVYGPPMPQWNAFAALAYTFEREAPPAASATPATTASKAPADETHEEKAAAPAEAAPANPTGTPPITEPPPPAIDTAIDTATDAAPPELATVPGPAAVPVPVPLPVPASSPALVPVSVHLVNDDDAEPAGATIAVFAANAEATAAPLAQGPTFALAAGTYVLQVEAPSHAPRERTFELRAGERLELDLFVHKVDLRPAVKVTARAIELGEPMRFGRRDARLAPDARPLLDGIVAALKEHREIKKLAIEGHTDNRGSVADNLKLSRDRAEAVRRYLVDHGIDAQRLTAAGFGESRPLEPNVTDRGRARNRRVELRILE